MSRIEECLGCSFARTYWIIQVLEDTNNRSIEYKNKFWIRQNAEKFHILVCVEDCGIHSPADLIKRISSANQDIMIIQEGEIVDIGILEGKIDYTKETLLVKQLGSIDPQYYIFLYQPH